MDFISVIELHATEEFLYISSYVYTSVYVLQPDAEQATHISLCLHLPSKDET